MDPLTHIVIGRAVVAAARDESRNRVVGAAAILGALSPDVDSALVFAGWDRYVRAHQFGTHSLLGALTMAMVTAVVVDRSAKASALRRSAKALAERPPIARLKASRSTYHANPTCSGSVGFSSCGSRSRRLTP